MRKPFFALIAASLVLCLVASDALAQPGSRLRRRLGGARNSDPAPSAEGASEPARPNGQLLQRLGGRLQDAVDSGALDAVLGQAGAPIPQLPQTPPAAGLASRAELRAQFSGSEPFTPSWFADHLRAWQFEDRTIDAWAPASISTATAWVGIAPASGSETLDPVQTPKTLPAGDDLPLGVFALTPAGGQDPSALLQVALTKDGKIVGNYFDIVTGTTQPLAGSLDKHTQLASFKLTTPGAAEFEAALVSLTRADGSIRLRFGGGEVSDWHLARYEVASATQPAATPAQPSPTAPFLTPPPTTPPPVSAPD